MKFVAPPTIIRKLYSSLIWRFSGEQKKICLTFDDGPIPELTPWVLDVLKEHKAKATFFCVGENVEKHPEIYKRILAEGHAVGNHTHNHLNGWKTKNDVYFDNIEKCTTALRACSPSPLPCRQAGLESPDSYRDGVRLLFRPPYGKIKRSQYSYLKSHYSIIMWDVLSYDFDTNTTPEQCYQHVIKHTRTGSIVVFHDNLKAKNNLTNTLPKILKHYQAKDFKFDTIAI